jgi:hypothetical protein
MALADRATELAPDDPAVKTLVETVTEGGRASRRRRALAIVAGGLALAAGATAIVATTMRGSHPAAPDAAIIASVVADAARPVDSVAIAEITAPDASVVIDAAAVRIDAHAITARHVDAATPDAPPIDAPMPIVPIDAAADTTPARIVVHPDMWCDLKIDDRSHGRASASRQIQVTPGHHNIRCEQPGLGRQWSQDVDLDPGEVRRFEVTLGVDVDITIALTRGSEVMIGPTHFPPTATTRLKAGRYEVTVPGVDKKFMSITRACTIRDAPELACY